MVSRKKQRIFAIIAVALGIIVALVIVELLFSLFISFSNTACGIMDADPDLGVRYKPNLDVTMKTTDFTMHIVTNSIGIKDREYGEKESFRILALGDSFTEGAVPELEQTYVKQLEKRLKNTSVINAGVSGYGSRQERIVLEKIGLNLDPDMVIVFFYQNDPEADYNQRNGPDITVEGDCVVSINTEKSLHTFMLKKSNLYYYLRVIAPNYPFVKSIGYPVRNALVDLGLAEKPELRYFVLKSEYGTYEEEAWQESLDNLAQIKSISDANEIPFVLVMIPMKFQVDDAIWEKYRKQNRVADDEYNFSRPSDILGEFAEEKDIVFVDLLPYFRNDENIGELYYNNDPHLTAYGNEIVAEILQEELTSRGLVNG